MKSAFASLRMTVLRPIAPTATAYSVPILGPEILKRSPGGRKETLGRLASKTGVAATGT